METVKTGTSEPLPQSGNDAHNASKKRKTLIFACSGASDTGKLTMQAASTLAFRRPDMYRTAAAHKGVDYVEDAISDGFRILALDGCTEYCATKKLNEAGLKADVQLMVTKLGIEKKFPPSVEYIEKIVCAIRDA